VTECQVRDHLAAVAIPWCLSHENLGSQQAVPALAPLVVLSLGLDFDVFDNPSVQNGLEILVARSAQLRVN